MQDIDIEHGWCAQKEDAQHVVTQPDEERLPGSERRCKEAPSSMHHKTEIGTHIYAWLTQQPSHMCSCQGRTDEYSLTCSTRQLTFWNRSLLYNLFKSIIHQLALNQKPQVTFPGWLPLQAIALTVSKCMTILGNAKSAKKLSQYAARSKS